MEQLNNRSLGELFSDLTQEIRQLIHSEVQLAKVELSQKAAAAGRSVGLIAAGGFVIYAGALVFVAALVLILYAIGLPPWAAALVGAVVVLGAGYLLVQSGLSALRKLDFTPTATIETLQQTAQVLKQDDTPR